MTEGRTHFVGVGGAGMSAIAKVLLELGMPVSGSDIKESANCVRLREQGAEITIGHASENVTGAATVVISSAIPESNPEIVAAREQGIEVLVRAQMLAKLGESKTTIAVAGTHGKTTTTSMIALVLERGGLQPTFLIGGEVNDIGSNAKHGAGDLMVVEADESDGSFLHLSPHVAVVTNVEADHLDHYQTLDRVHAAFEDFLEKVPSDGAAVICGDDKDLLAIAGRAGVKTVTYGFADSNDFVASDVCASDGGTSFSVSERGRELGRAALRVPGKHNVANGMATIALCRRLGMEFETIAEVLSQFSGVQRRFQRMGCERDVTVVDDYAHHPTEVRATLAAARDGRWQRVVCVFQPHRFSRTKLLGNQFDSAFDDADIVVLTEVYGAGEEPEPGVSGKLLVDAVLHRRPRSQVAYIPKRAGIASYLRDSVRQGDLVITMGAGDVWTVGTELLEAMTEHGAAGEVAH